MPSVAVTQNRALDREPFGRLPGKGGYGVVRRRPFLITAGALLAGTRTQAQAPRKLPRVGFVLTTASLATMSGTEPTELVMRGFVHGLRALGYVEGQNIVIERRSAEGKLERLEELIQGLVKLPVDVLVVSGTQMVQVAKKITTMIPVVVAGMSTPVETGIVSSLARPGGNITGLVVGITPEFDIKRLELIREMLPKASRIAFLGTKEDWTRSVHGPGAGRGDGNGDDASSGRSADAPHRGGARIAKAPSARCASRCAESIVLRAQEVDRGVRRENPCSGFSSLLPGGRGRGARLVGHDASRCLSIVPPVMYARFSTARSPAKCRSSRSSDTSWS